MCSRCAGPFCSKPHGDRCHPPFSYSGDRKSRNHEGDRRCCPGHGRFHQFDSTQLCCGGDQSVDYETEKTPKKRNDQKLIANYQQELKSWASKPEFKEFHIILPTAIVLIEDGAGHKQFCRAILDSCSRYNLITPEAVAKYRLDTTRNEHRTRGSYVSVTSNKKASAYVCSRHHRFRAKCDFAVTEMQQDRVGFCSKGVKIPADLPLADPVYHLPAKIDILLGAEMFPHLQLKGKITLGGAVLQNTVFGWTLSGRLDNVTIYLYQKNKKKVLERKRKPDKEKKCCYLCQRTDCESSNPRSQTYSAASS